MAKLLTNRQVADLVEKMGAYFDLDEARYYATHNPKPGTFHEWTFALEKVEKELRERERVMDKYLTYLDALADAIDMKHEKAIIKHGALDKLM